MPPFARFSRDKRGYDHVYLIHSSTRHGVSERPRILYCHRTPAGARIGREPFDESVRRALEEHYPDLEFEWSKLQQMATAPSPEAEAWRDRRRTNRAAAAATPQVEHDATDEEILLEAIHPASTGQVQEGPAAGELSGTFEEEVRDDANGPADESAEGGEEAVSASASAPQTAPGSPTSDNRGRGRRRRRRRKRSGSAGGEPGPGSASV